MNNDFKKKLEDFSLPDGRKVPYCLHEGIVDYVRTGAMTGGFLTAVLCNNLRGAFEQGDCHSIVGLQALVSFLYSEAPAACWGSIAKFEAWQERDGLNGCPYKSMSLKTV